jgi:hypothetical protein
MSDVKGIIDENPAHWIYPDFSGPPGPEYEILLPIPQTEGELPMPDWKAAQREAAKIARWAVIMTKCRIKKLITKTTWNLVTFCGKKGGESTGIVDMMAIRKDHHEGVYGLKRGDAFEVILIQVKGGGAAWPTPDDIRRLKKVGHLYGAKAVILSEWKKGRQTTLYRLNMDSDPESASCWQRLDKPLALFR